MNGRDELIRGARDGSVLSPRLTRRATLRLAAIAAITAVCQQTTPPATEPPAAASPAAALPLKGLFDPAKATEVRVKTLEDELALPPSVLDAARREGKVTFISSIDEANMRPILAAFRKRYQGIAPQYQEASEEVRSVRTLTEFKAGRASVDVVGGIGGFLKEFNEAKALRKLDDLPAFKNYDQPFRGKESEWAGTALRFWGIGYNTEKVKPDQLPRTWEELGDPRWKGRFGLGDRPQLWAQQLWKAWGPERTTEFLRKLFANEPQRRKEGLGASARLLGAGEYDLYIPAGTHTIRDLAGRGSPVGWHSPSPLTVAVSEAALLATSPSPSAGIVFLNWFLSREGQDAYAKADSIVPTHPALRLTAEYYGGYADRIVGQPWSIREPDDEVETLPEVRRVWQPLWIG